MPWQKPNSFSLHGPDGNKVSTEVSVRSIVTRKTVDEPKRRVFTRRTIRVEMIDDGSIEVRADGALLIEAVASNSIRVRIKDEVP